MSKSVDEIVVGANGTIRVAAVGTVAPANIAASFGAGWVDLGYTDEKGVKVKDDKKITDIAVWQLFYPARKIIDSRAFSVIFVLRQFSGLQVQLAFGGGDVDTDGGGGFIYTPPDPSLIDERALAVDWADGDRNYRLIVLRGLVQAAVETDIFRTGAADLPIEFGVIGSDTDNPYELQTDDPAFAEAT